MPASVFTDWTEYPNDPLTFPLDSISSTFFDDYFPYTIYDKDSFSGHGDSVLYKMWCQGKNTVGSNANIALLYSSDGINWTLKSQAVINDPDPASHPSHPVVLYDPNGFGGGIYFYQMWYWTLHSSVTTVALTLKSALSVDGINWTVPVTNTQDTTQYLALTTGPTQSQPFYQFNGFGTVIYNPNATSTPGQPFSFPYAVFFDSVAHFADLHYQQAIGLAYSIDGVNWIRYGTNPVFVPSTNAADWDGLYKYRASVLKLADGKYHMYYSGSNGSPSIGLFYAHGIGYASSPDGINWTPDPANPIFFVTDPGFPWRSNHTLAPSVVVTSNSTCSQLLQMWFSGGDAPSNRRMGFATLPCLSPITPPSPPAPFFAPMICPPVNFSVSKKYTPSRFNLLKWEPSQGCCTAGYKIFRGDFSNCIGIVCADKKLRFIDRNPPKGSTYIIVAFDCYGNTSVPVCATAK